MATNNRTQQETHPFGVPYQVGTWHLAVGVLLSLLGVAALLLPLAGELFPLVFAWLFVFTGVVLAAHAVLGRHWSGAPASLFRGIAFILGGVTLYVGAAHAATAAGVVFLVEGAIAALNGYRLRPAERWNWMLADGACGLLLGLVLLSVWSEDAVWPPGVIAGFRLLIAGLTMIMLSRVSRQSVTEIP